MTFLAEIKHGRDATVSHYCHVRYSFRCRSGLRICPIVPFRRPKRAFWQHRSRAVPRQPAHAGCSGPSALPSRHRQRRELSAVGRERKGVGSPPVHVAMERAESEESVLHRSQP